ncbi:P1 family peptidase [Thermodesulforhabdus norvegica]|uniref:L-aminopeptidase/D-esterase n=1 Tax=Thermodesulforhabdus norvegica TaxID=39841 RepID=A0A1I4VYQ7_9BACT|nr:P1 family peptidase [Thermodesulforhabdus norvegica]SFN06474.1 L-aminopeptidase/D-esterase [Thermodesulforhabdus norvegica]
MNDTLTAVLGLKVGHAHVEGFLSGCTVILTPPEGCPAGVDIRGGAPGTYGTDSLAPVNLVERVHGIFLSGGSAFGLAVGDGVRRFLKENNVGFETGYEKVPIVCGAIIFDLGINKGGKKPDSDLGYEACRCASSEPVLCGNVGAGAGATVGKLFGLERAMKGGLGSYCITTPYGLKVAALMVVNAFGDIWDPREGRLLAGCRKSPDSRELADARECIRGLKVLRGFPDGNNTVIGVVATNAEMNKTQLTKVAQMAHDGIARTVVPAHTQYDGDTIFAISCGDLKGVETSVVGHLAADAVSEAIVRAVRSAVGVKGIPAWKEIQA